MSRKRIKGGVPQKKDSSLPKPQIPQTVSTKKEITSVEKLVGFSGPLPDPKSFGQYEGILLGAADRILTMAEEQAHHRHEMEKKDLKSSIITERFGMIIGGIITLGAFTMAIWCAYLKQPVASILFGMGTMGSLIAIFLVGTRRKRQEDS